MEIRIYDRELNFQGIIENQTSLLWTRKYFEPGTFELHVPVTTYNTSLMQLGNLVTMHGQDDAGVIEDIQYEESVDKNEITAQGRFLSAYMEYRLIVGTVNINSTVEVAMRDLLQRCTAIPLVTLGALHGFTKTVDGQVTNVNLLTFMKKLAKAGNLGYIFRPDFTAKTITFDTYEGVDRRLSQTVNNRVVFSESYDNLAGVTYKANDQSYANVAYAYGKDADENEVSLVVGDTDATGLDRREIYVDGSGINATDLTADEYKAKLRQEAQNTLNAKAMSETFECDTYAEGNFTYRTHYDLGDIVTIHKAGWDIRRDLRITEILETYEYGTMTVTPTFGNPLATAIDWSDLN